MQEKSGLAPTPGQMQMLRDARQAKPTEGSPKKKGKGQQKFVRVTVDSPSFRSEIQHILYGVHWQYQKRILDILKIVTDNEKWETTRTIVMDIQNEQIENMRILVTRRIDEHLIQEENERKNGYQESNTGS